MALQKIEHASCFSVELGEDIPKYTNKQIGELMSEFCEGVRSRCAKTGGCIIGATSNVHLGTVNVNLHCSAQSSGDSLEHCSFAQRTAESIDGSLKESILGAIEE